MYYLGVWQVLWSIPSVGTGGRGMQERAERHRSIDPLNHACLWSKRHDAVCADSKSALTGGNASTQYSVDELEDLLHNGVLREY